MTYKKIAIIANKTPQAQDKLAQINKTHKFIQLDYSTKEAPQDLDLIIVLGGDGFMLHCLHTYMHLNIPFYGINCGTVGFLLNQCSLKDLDSLLDKATTTTITYPLEMTAYLSNGQTKTHLAINEVSLFRKTSQASKIRITIDNEIRVPELVADGILLSTPAGSSAYNSSVNGPILPIGSNILALTPISPFQPKKWSGAILPHTATVELTILNPEHRPVNAVADFLEVSSVTSVKIKENRERPIRLLFDNNHSLEERILKEQFAYDRYSSQ
jgi:NAD+ kinase